jgi:hypothetical protein
VQLTGWLNWKQPVVEFSAVEDSRITVGVHVKCAPGG